MIEGTNINQPQRILQITGDKPIRLAGLCRTGGMIMREDHRSGIMAQRCFHNLAGVYFGMVDSSGEQGFIGQ